MIEWRSKANDGTAREVKADTRTVITEFDQIKADVLNLPLHVLAFQEMGTFGAALLAGVGSGVYNSLEEAACVADQASNAEIIAPDPTWAGLYDELFALYAELYPQTEDLVRRLGQ